MHLCGQKLPGNLEHVAFCFLQTQSQSFIQTARAFAETSYDGDAFSGNQAYPWTWRMELLKQVRTIYAQENQSKARPDFIGLAGPAEFDKIGQRSRQTSKTT